MLSYFKKLALFSIPIWLYAIFIVLIDPYNFIGFSHVINDVDKIAVLNRSNESGPRGNMLWKAKSFKKNPSPIVLIGDSQGRKINESLIKQASGENCFNFCIPGGSFSTSVENFWFISGLVELKKVYFVISFMNYNANRDYTLSHFAADYFKNPFTYFTTKEILLDSWANFWYHTTGSEKIVKNPYEFQTVKALDSLSVSQYDLFFGDYKYPDKYYEELKSIRKYCDEKNIELMFILLPTYQHVEDYLLKSGYEAAFNQFKKDIQSVASVRDYSHYQNIFDNRDCFVDYYHIKQEPLDEITLKIWTDLNIN